MDSNKGFTLVEMIVAITILGLVMALAYAAFHVANRSMSSVSRVQQDTEELRTINNILTQHLSRASNQITDVLFLGESNELSFSAMVPIRATGGGRPYHFHLYQKQTGEMTQLLLTYKAADFTNEEETTTLSLAEYKGNIRFFYLTSSADNAEEQWQESWRSYRLPVLVKLQFDDSSTFWPQQVVRLRYADA